MAALLQGRSHNPRWPNMTIVTRSSDPVSRCLGADGRGQTFAIISHGNQPTAFDWHTSTLTSIADLISTWANAWLCPASLIQVTRLLIKTSLISSHPRSWVLTEQERMDCVIYMLTCRGKRCHMFQVHDHISASAQLTQELKLHALMLFVLNLSILLAVE